MSYRTHRSVRYRYRCRAKLTEVSGSGIDVVPNLMKFPLPVLMPYRTLRSGTDVVPNSPKCPVPVSMLCETYRSIRYRYWCRIELAEISGTGINAVPIFPKCVVPVLMSYRTYRVSDTGNTGGIYCRYALVKPYWTHPCLYAVQTEPFGLSNEKIVNNNNVVSSNLKDI